MNWFLGLVLFVVGFSVMSYEGEPLGDPGAGLTAPSLPTIFEPPVIDPDADPCAIPIVTTDDGVDPSDHNECLRSMGQ